jgi:membrane-bound lytic murein transglycosylase D
MLTLLTSLWIVTSGSLTVGLAQASTTTESVMVEGNNVAGWVQRINGTMSREKSRVSLPSATMSQTYDMKSVTPTSQGLLPIEGYDIAAIDPSDYDIPIEMNASILRWITYFTGPGKQTIRIWNERKGRVEPLISSKLKEAGLPADLIYLAMIESGFVDSARSHAGATGPWQFMKITARECGLRVDDEVDERRDLLRATEAAIEYLSMLHRRFDDWPLAMASYNGGQGRVRRAQKRSGEKNYYALAGGGHLPKETANYVPKIIAAAIVSKNFVGFGIAPITPESPREVTRVAVTATTDLDVIAKISNTDMETIVALNPALLRAYTPHGTTMVAIPVQDARAFEDKYARLSPQDRRVLREYKVVRGDTLSEIAERHGLSLSELKRINNLRSDQIQLGQLLFLDGSKVNAGAPSHYTVRAGDTISEIAERHDCTAAELRKLNGLNSSVIQPGQRLKVPRSNG